jgi:DNA-binding transcriptional regulator PaaX
MRKITKIKTTYYSKEILKYLLLGGMIYMSASSPYFVMNLMKNVSQYRSGRSKNKFTNAFNYLKRKGLIEMRKENHDICIALTEEGKKRAGKYQINDLEIERPKKWDEKWRIVIFDIPNVSGVVRNIFRKKLKEFGFYPLQKSIWAFPFPCEEEIVLLRDFLGADKKQIQVLEVSKMEDDWYLRRIFHL